MVDGRICAFLSQITHIGMQHIPHGTHACRCSAVARVAWVKSVLGRVACVDFGSSEQACHIEQMFDYVDMMVGPAVVRR